MVVVLFSVPEISFKKLGNMLWTLIVLHSYVLCKSLLRPRNECSHSLRPYLTDIAIVRFRFHCIERYLRVLENRETPDHKLPNPD